MPNQEANPSVEVRIRTFIAENLLYAEDGFPYSDDASFLREGIVDSLGVMHLVEFVGKDFHITVGQHEVTPDNFDSIKNLARFVRRKLEEKSASSGN